MKRAQLKIGDKTLELPIITGTENEKGIDVTRLRAETKYITFDPYYANTGSCTSDITYINGEEGILRYRGYLIEQLAENASFVEVIYLLLYRELPTKEQLDKLSFQPPLTLERQGWLSRVKKYATKIGCPLPAFALKGTE